MTARAATSNPSLPHGTPVPAPTPGQTVLRADRNNVQAVTPTKVVTLTNAVPTRVRANEVCVVDEDTQMLYRLPIRVEGGIVVRGGLVML